ncbi:MAG TPA: methylmalonyl-CoA epimerase [Candidatus Polarisedimenticolia bacterium]|nr:methylmalonyl-CoA epimerase [Candidatus Polarisedimenticolia bacterium]
MTWAEIGAVDHIGIAVASIAKALEFYEGALGLAARPPEEVPTEQVRVAFLPVGETRLELLEPLSPESPVARFISRRGEGIHHLCLRVGDLDAALQAVEARGGEIIPPAPRVGAGGRRIAFIHPRSTGGVLIELKEYREPA